MPRGAMRWRDTRNSFEGVCNQLLMAMAEGPSPVAVGEPVSAASALLVGSMAYDDKLLAPNWRRKRIYRVGSIAMADGSMPAV